MVVQRFIILILKQMNYLLKKKIIQNKKGQLNLRTHIISSTSAKITSDKKYVTSVEGWKVKNLKKTGQETLKIFKELSKKIFNKKNLWKIKLKKEIY